MLTFFVLFPHSHNSPLDVFLLSRPSAPIHLFSVRDGDRRGRAGHLLYRHFAGRRIPGSHLVRSFVHVARVVPPPLGHARLGPGMSVKPEVVLQFPEPVRGLNGSCLIAPNIILIADCFASLIWRVDLPSGDGKVTARVWLEDESMATDPDGPFPDQPGVNGVGYASKTNYLITRRPPKNSLCGCASTQIRTRECVGRSASLKGTKI